MLKKKNGVVRSIDIANDLGVSKPSVSVAMKNLRADNYIKVDENGHIHLTGSGLEIANKIYERHTFLTGWLSSICVYADIAAEEACRIEHVLSGQSFEAIKKYIAER